jgi:hypothetical protein
MNLTSPITILTLFVPVALAQDAPGTKPAEERPWRVTFSAAGSYQFDADQKNGSGTVSVGRLGASAGLAAPIAERSELHMGLAWRESWFSFDNVPTPTPGSTFVPWDETTDITLSATFSSQSNEHWGWFAGGRATFAGESGTEFSDSLSGGVFAGASYGVNDRLSFTFGVGAYAPLESSTFFAPILGIEWKFADEWTLTSRDRLGLFVEWNATERLTLSLGAEYLTGDYRLSDRHVFLPGGVGRERSVPLLLSLAWEVDPTITVSFDAGLMAWERFRVDTAAGSKVTQFETDPAFMFGCGVKLAF